MVSIDQSPHPADTFSHGPIRRALANAVDTPATTAQPGLLTIETKQVLHKQLLAGYEESILAAALIDPTCSTPTMAQVIAKIAALDEVILAELATWQEPTLLVIPAGSLQKKIAALQTNTLSTQSIVMNCENPDSNKAFHSHIEPSSKRLVLVEGAASIPASVDNEHKSDFCNSIKSKLALCLKHVAQSPAAGHISAIDIHSYLVLILRSIKTLAQTGGLIDNASNTQKSVSILGSHFFPDSDQILTGYITSNIVHLTPYPASWVKLAHMRIRKMIDLGPC